MQLKQKINFLISKIRKIPIWVAILIAVLLALLIVSLIYLQEKTVIYSYSDKNTCIRQLTFLPNIVKNTDNNSNINIENSELIKLGNLQLFSLKTCFSTKNAPSVGKVRVNIALFGGWFANKTYVINILQPPEAHLGVFEQSIPILRPLIIKLSSSDVVFDYKLEIDGKTTNCPMKNSSIYCDIKSLQLLQGEDYKAKLVRLFNFKQVAVLFNRNIKTLNATTVISASINRDQTIFDKPKNFTFDFDKTIVAANVLLEKVEGDKRTPITTSIEINNKQIKVMLDDNLDRDSSYVFTVDKLEAQDGSSLIAPYTVNFKISDGPSVISVNTEAFGAPLTHTILLTFDQPLSDAQDISKFFSVVGVLVSVRKTANNQVSISYVNAPLCADITVKVNAGLESNYNIIQNDSKNISIRTICHTTLTIGYSVLGRPILAYVFGNGSTTILFTGGIHGSEPSGSYIMHDWVFYLESNTNKIPANKKIVVVPEVNPDGLSVLSRYNANNVNIDRNFSSANWASDIDTGSGLMVGGGGSSAMSEPETKALANLTASLQPRLEVSFHAKGSLIGANQYGDSVSIGNHYASSVGYRSMIGQAEEVMGYTITGEYEEWEGERGIPAILIELPTSTGRHFWAHQSILWEMVNL